jgi:hypothetical protein
LLSPCHHPIIFIVFGAEVVLVGRGSMGQEGSKPRKRFEEGVNPFSRYNGESRGLEPTSLIK